MILGCVVALLCSAGAGAAFVLGEVHTLRDALSQNSALNLPSGTLAPAGWGEPQTLLLVGDDQRALTPYYHQAVLPHSNEMLLVRIDPSKPYISMMSIPRELQVTIYPSGQAPTSTRFNYAYTAGGIPLLLSTIKRVLGLSVNHVMVITFGRFKRAVDQMGCAYSTVDRRYFHINVPGGEQYQEINLQPGYQDLCGTPALEFVSYRHADTSLVRDARDQSFLLDVKKQYGPTLADNVGKFEHIFGQAVQTDRGLQSSTGLLNLIGTLISSAGRRVRQVQFQANLVPPNATPCECVTASQQQIDASVHSFLYGSSPVPKQSTAAVAHAVHANGAVAQLPLAPITSSELAQAHAAAAGMPFPYELPRVQDRGGNGTPASFRDYLIHAPDGSAYPAYDEVFATGTLGQYYDVQGTTWTTAPLLDSPEQTVQVGGRTYYLQYESQNLQTVAWMEDGAAYWIHNSLTNAIPNGELLAIAEQTTAIGGRGATGGARPPRKLNLGAAAVPARASAAPDSGALQTLGYLAALLGLLALPPLALALVRGRRQLVALRSHLETSARLEGQLISALSGQGIALPAPSPAPALPAPAPALRAGTISVYRAPLRWRLLLGVAVAMAVAGLMLGVFLAAEGGHAARGRAVARKGQALVELRIPTVPVAVLNANGAAGAANRLGQQLRSRGANVAAVNNLDESRPPGLWILYTPGQRNSAVALAHLVTEGATIAPIDPAAQAAAGPRAQVVVVLA